MIFTKLSPDVQHIASNLGRALEIYRPHNKIKWDYYDTQAAIRNIGLAVPETMVNVDVVLGWPEIVVDTLDERLDWLGWSSATGDVSGLMQVFRDNQLAHEFDKAKLDALVTGVGFLEVSAGDVDADEPPVIVSAVSSMDATFVWDERRNRVASGMVRKSGDNGEVFLTVYLPDRTIAAVWADGEERVSEHVHNRGRCGLIPIMNRKRAGQSRGKSEITKAIRYYTDHGVRTLLGMEYNREIYTTPQRWFSNTYSEDFGFKDTDTAAEVAARGVKIAMNRAVILEPNYDEDGNPGPEPKTGQYQSAPPTPYIEELKMMAQTCAAQAGVPVSSFGFHSENPPSADAIRALESRLVKRAERRQSLFNEPLRNDLAFVIESILRGEPADRAFVASLDILWRDAATPTKAASVDAAGKLVSNGILDADSTVLLEMVGFTPEQVERVQMERARSVSRKLVESIRDRQGAPDPLATELSEQTVPVEGGENDAKVIKAKADAMGVLIRAGVKFHSAMQAVGLTGLEFHDGVPITLKYAAEGNE